MAFDVNNTPKYWLVFFLGGGHIELISNRFEEEAIGVWVAELVKWILDKKRKQKKSSCSHKECWYQHQQIAASGKPVFGSKWVFNAN